MRKLAGFGICVGFLAFCWYSFDHIDHAESVVITQQWELSQQESEQYRSQLATLKDINKSLLEESEKVARLKKENPDQEVDMEHFWILTEKMRQQVEKIDATMKNSKSDKTVEIVDAGN